MEFIKQPWPWYVAGPLIALVMFTLMLFGKRFGISSNLQTVCSIMGAGKRIEYFAIDWRKQGWNLVFVLGTVLGGFIANRFLMTGEPVQIANETVTRLEGFGVELGTALVPTSLFSFESLGSLSGLVMLVGGGFLIGFGTRYGDGCTSGHAISGISNLQPASIIATISFFVGGMITTHFLLPILFNL